MKLDIKRIGISLIPLFGLAAILTLYLIPVTRYVHCNSGNCASIPKSLDQVIIPDDPRTRTPLPGDNEETLKKKTITAQSRAASIYAGRLNFLFLLMVYLSLSLLGLGVACYVIYKSGAKTVSKPGLLVLICLAASALGFLYFYNFPTDYMAVFIPLLQNKIHLDLPAAQRLLVFTNSLGFS